MRARLEREVAEALRDLGLGPGDRAGVACSGGPDSAALAAAAAACRARGDIGPVTVIHVDHGLRSDSEADARTVGALARDLGLEYRLRRVDVAARGSLEAAAREARYRALAEVVGERDLAVVLLGHTASDQAETVLMRIVRGTGIPGLAGIPPARGVYARPLLGISRGEVEDYVAARGIAALADPTNRDPAHTRNRFRHRIVPALGAENPRLEEALGRLAARAREQREVLDYAADALSARAGRGGALAAYELAAAPEAVAARALARRAEEVTGRPLASGHLRAVLGLCRGPARGSRAIAIPGGRALREYDALHFEAAAAAAPASDPDLDGDLDVEGPDGPYAVRVWRPGDRMRPARLRGRSRKLSDLYIDAKIPRRLRERARVVVRVGDGAIQWAEHLGKAHGAALAVTLTPRGEPTSNRG